LTRRFIRAIRHGRLLDFLFRNDLVFPQQSAAGLIGHHDPEIDISRRGTRDADDTPADALDPNCGRIGGKFIGPHELSRVGMTRSQHEVRLSGPLRRARNPRHCGSWLNMRHNLMGGCFGMISDRQIQAAFP
jgi:hypothetical protein